MPRIISGSSSGAIIASFLCTRNEKELEDALNLTGINLNFFGEAPSNRPDFRSSLFHISNKLLRAVYTGTHASDYLICATKDLYLRGKFCRLP